MPAPADLWWFRSWPVEIPAGRAYVSDSLPRLVMTGHDYWTVATYQPWPTVDPGFCMLEWDVALDRVGREQFQEQALKEPDRVLVAPYPIYPVGGPPSNTCRIRGHPAPWNTDIAETFGLGCVYFPQSVLALWQEQMRGVPFTDREFSTWHLRTYGPARVATAVHPQHLHGD